LLPIGLAAIPAVLTGTMVSALFGFKSKRHKALALGC